MTGDSRESETDRTEDGLAVGEQVKKLRSARGWSLKELSARANVSVGLLSQIERGLSVPSLRTLTKIRHSLDVSLGELVGLSEPQGSNEQRYVKRAADRDQLVIGDNQLVKYFLSPTRDESLQLMLLDVPPGGGAGAQSYSYQGLKGGLVLEGGIQLKLGPDVFNLATGDSFQFDSSVPHTFHNLGSKPAKVVWVIATNPIQNHI